MRNKGMNELTRTKWMAALSGIFQLKTGHTVAQFGYGPDAFHDMYEDGLTPSEAFEEEQYAASVL